MINFPSAPTTGQVYKSHKWDGEKWTCGTAPLPIGDPPSDINPLMNGMVLPGLVYKYARGDHRHPLDTSRAPLNNASLTGTTSGPNASISGDFTVSGTITATGNGHVMGWPSGDANASMAKADTNILLYEVDANNWAGIGTDINGRFFVRTGLSGTPAPAFWIDQSRVVQFLKSPTSPTPGAGDNSTRAATTAFVLANPASGPYLPLSGGTVTGLMYVNGDMRNYRAGDINQGIIFLSNNGGRYLHFHDDQYYLNAAHCYTANGRLWGNGDFGWPFINERLAYGWDQDKGINTGLSEDFGGACITGASGYGSSGTQTSRYRQWQLQWGYGTWAAIGYA